MEKSVSKSRKTTMITHQRDVAEFILAMTVELSELAYKNGLDSLTIAFDVAREAAETELSRSVQTSLNS
jgi:hypothetical protein